ncbi:hypothetical protein CHS0354_027724 [Potamilus streckersoni]|uniref:Uncharacterized protein n=1 Tax=Potamilus streckersoni TaxID=2493646 RepID=A0AAE0VQL8_9BIVA|nr:hypothetical protein CHS0354_027724 [Potamilus streckersoni]
MENGDRISGMERHRISGMEQHRISGMERHRISGMERHRITGMERHRISGMERHRISGMKRQKQQKRDNDSPDDVRLKAETINLYRWLPCHLGIKGHEMVIKAAKATPRGATFHLRHEREEIVKAILERFAVIYQGDAVLVETFIETIKPNKTVDDGRTEKEDCHEKNKTRLRELVYLILMHYVLGSLSPVELIVIQYVYREFDWVDNNTVLLQKALQC